jgi:hypothetical protein
MPVQYKNAYTFLVGMFEGINTLDTCRLEANIKMNPKIIRGIVRVCELESNRRRFVPANISCGNPYKSWNFFISGIFWTGWGTLNSLISAPSIICSLAPFPFRFLVRNKFCIIQHCSFSRCTFSGPSLRYSSLQTRITQGDNFSETSALTRTTQCQHIPEDSIRHCYRRENKILQSYIYIYMY